MTGPDRAAKLDGVPAPRRSYLIGANQRCGTTLLCRGLTDTGVAGRPEEYFLAVDEEQQPGWRTWEEGPFGVTHGATDRATYLDLVHRLGTTPNGVFGAQLMANNLPWAMAKFRELPRFSGRGRAAILHEVFPSLQVVNLTRRDRVAQAVSWARAAQDGVWLISDDEPAEPTGPTHYDEELITNLVRLIEEGERAWRELYDELGLVPCEVVYEDLASADGWEPTLRSVLRHLDLDASNLPRPAPRTARQADALNDEWSARFRARNPD